LRNVVITCGALPVRKRERSSAKLTSCVGEDFMANTDPRQEITQRIFPASGSRGGFGGRIETLKFLKERRSGRRMVQAVSFETVSGRKSLMICYLLQNDRSEWKFSGAAGEEENQGGQIRAQPTVDIEGGGWPDYFYAGGRVLEHGRQIARVRLITGNDVVMEDSVENGLVVFVTEERVHLPIQAELYDQTGNLVNCHHVLNV
jgi:hypothetical protein